MNNSDGESDLFTPLVAPEKLDPSFKRIMNSEPGTGPARAMLKEVFSEFQDPDGNFIEQFQTSGFDSRCFELYLFAYFSRSGFSVDRSLPSPDFLITKNNITICVEATTANPTQAKPSNIIAKETEDRKTAKTTGDGFGYRTVKLGSALYSKLQQKYWELAHCKDLPIVLAIEGFYEEDSLTHSVIFTNAGTYAKFSRMGFQSGLDVSNIAMTRIGYCNDPDPNSMDPTFFQYDLRAPPLVESWGQGLVVFHNPNALYPIPREFWGDTVQGYVQEGQLKFDLSSWHPYSSVTQTRYFEGQKSPPLLTPNILVRSVHRQDFRSIVGISESPLPDMFVEDGWFADNSLSFLGVIINDKADGDWGYVVLARDQRFQFRAIESEGGVTSRVTARSSLQNQMAKYLLESQRIFPQ